MININDIVSTPQGEGILRVICNYLYYVELSNSTSTDVITDVITVYDAIKKCDISYHCTKFYQSEVIYVSKGDITTMQSLSIKSISYSNNIILNLVEQILEIDNIKIALTNKEYKLCYLFFTNFNVLITREQINNLLWNDNKIYDNKINVYICSIKKHLPNLITKKKVGYILNKDTNE